MIKHTWLIATKILQHVKRIKNGRNLVTYKFSELMYTTFVWNSKCTSVRSKPAISLNWDDLKDKTKGPWSPGAACACSHRGSCPATRSSPCLGRISYGLRLNVFPRELEYLTPQMWFDYLIQQKLSKFSIVLKEETCTETLRFVKIKYILLWSLHLSGRTNQAPRQGLLSI